MVMKKDRRKGDIKSKLVAAIAMLMVSCIMVVSSTYAWFTLSTAPEVTGITTAVGANGNLEMALLPTGQTVADALNAIGVNSVTNNTWGNLVDLTTGYGLEQIVMNPSTMTPTAEGNLPSNFLSAPTYGPDGRFSGLNNSIMDKTYLNGAFNTDGYGVRALGTSSGMSAREMAYRNALSAADTAFDNALAAAKNAVSDGGTTLADLAIKKAQDDDATYGQTDIQALLAAYGYIETGLDKIEQAIKLYIIADHMATTAVTDDNFATVQAELAQKTMAELITDGKAAGISNITDIQTALNNLRTVVTTNVTTLNGMNTETAAYKWDDLSSYVTPLANVDNMLLNGHQIRDYLNGTADLGQLTNGERRLVVNTAGTDTSGLFVGMANFVDSFSTPVVFEELKYGTITVTNISVTMVINKNSSVEPAYLEVMDAAATAYDTGVFSSGATNIDSFYGFIIDMAFRTNAAGSDLLLQTDAIDRIYSDNTANPDTMGGGSYMTYTATTASGYNADQLKGLMENIRIVLFDPATNKILGYARLDVSEATVSAVEGDSTTAGSITVSMPIKMWDIKINTDDDDELEGNWAANAKITSLVQNTATAISAMVYLEGTTLENADVANGEITGEMNLQFASSAELKPMEYNDLRKPSDSTSTTTTTPTATQMTAVTAPDGYATTAAFTGSSIAMTIANTDGTETVTVTVGSTNYPATYVDGGWVVANVAETLAADTAITVAVTEAP